MATPPYVNVNPNVPDGVTQTPAAYSASDLANVRALRDAIITGMLVGWNFTKANPQDHYWGSGSQILRMYLSTAAAPASVDWYWSNDGGATYVLIIQAHLTWNASGQIATCDNGAGSWIMWLSAYIKSQANVDAMNAHIAQTTGAHGTGTLALQNANAVNISGGTLTTVNINGSNLNGFGRAYPQAPSTLASGVDWNWAAIGNHFNIAPGSAIPQITNPQGGEVKRIWVTNAGAITVGAGAVGFAWMTGHPVFSATGGTLVQFVAIANNFVIGTTTP